MSWWPYCFFLSDMKVVVIQIGTGDTHWGGVGALCSGALGRQGDTVACGRFKVRDIRDLAFNGQNYLEGRRFSVFPHNQGVITCTSDWGPLHMQGHALHKHNLDFRHRQQVCNSDYFSVVLK